MQNGIVAGIVCVMFALGIGAVVSTWTAANGAVVPQRGTIEDGRAATGHAAPAAPAPRR